MPEKAWRYCAAPLSLVAASVLARSTPLLGVEPVIDMHVHADFTERAHPVRGCTGDQSITYAPIDPAKASAESASEICERPILSETKSEAFERHTIAALRKAGVRRAMLMGKAEALKRWGADAPDLFIPATTPTDLSPASVAQVRQLASDGRIGALGETGLQYVGLRADDPGADSFWSLAEELDLPVGIHLGMGMPLAGEDARRDPYRAELTTPFQLEAVIKKHPRLRIYVMHAASPLIDEMIAMLFTYPALYVDVSANDWNMPRAQFYNELSRLVDAGFSKRIMFGSDQTIWPQSIPLAIRTINDAPFLTRQQKRDILYNNAARFLRLTPEQIAADHRPLKRRP